MSEGGRIVIQIDEDETLPDFKPVLRQRTTLLVEGERSFHQRCSDQPAIRAINPAMVGADKPFVRSLLVERDGHVAMATDVGKRTDHTIGATHNKHGVIDDLHGEPVTGIGNIVGAPDQKPFVFEYRLDLKLVEARICVGRRWQREARRIGCGGKGRQRVEQIFGGTGHRSYSAA